MEKKINLKVYWSVSVFRSTLDGVVRDATKCTSAYLLRRANGTDFLTARCPLLLTLVEVIEEFAGRARFVSDRRDFFDDPWSNWSAVFRLMLRGGVAGLPGVTLRLLTKFSLFGDSRSSAFGDFPLRLLLSPLLDLAKLSCSLASLSIAVCNWTSSSAESFSRWNG